MSTGFNQTAETDQRKVTVTLPLTLLARLDKQIPSRQRSDFIARAIEEQLALLEQTAAIEESAGAWRDETYADMMTDEDINRWLADVRGPAGARIPAGEGQGRQLAEAQKRG